MFFFFSFQLRHEQAQTEKQIKIVQFISAIFTRIFHLSLSARWALLELMKRVAQYATSAANKIVDRKQASFMLGDLTRPQQQSCKNEHLLRAWKNKLNLQTNFIVCIDTTQSRPGIVSCIANYSCANINLLCTREQRARKKVEREERENLQTTADQVQVQ